MKLTAITLTTLLVLARSGQAQTAAPKYPNYPSETPTEFKPVTDSFDYVKREVMIPMRDGVKLHTIVLVPKGAHNSPILLTRTPYSARVLTGHAQSSHLGPILNGYDNALEPILEVDTSAPCRISAESTVRKATTS